MCTWPPTSSGPQEAPIHLGLRGETGPRNDLTATLHAPLPTEVSCQGSRRRGSCRISCNHAYTRAFHEWLIAHVGHENIIFSCHCEFAFIRFEVMNRVMTFESLWSASSIWFQWMASRPCWSWDQDLLIPLRFDLDYDWRDRREFRREGEDIQIFVKILIDMHFMGGRSTMLVINHEPNHIAAKWP